MTRSDGTWFVLSLESDRYIALHARGSGGASPLVRVLGSASGVRPASIDPLDTAAMGEWLAGELKEASLDGASRRSRVVFAVPRSEVMLKRVTLPPGTLRADRPEIVRLQMIRQLTLSPESAVIDFADGAPPAERGGKTGAEASTVTQSLLAGALQADRIAWRRAVAQAAGMKASSMSLKASGAAAMLADAVGVRAGATGSGGVMGITLGCGATEFLIVENGQLVFARGSDLLRPDASAGGAAEDEAFAEKVAVEAKRTWMSYRSTPESIEVESVFVLGADRCAGMVADRCRESLALRAESARLPAYVELPPGMEPLEASLAPLIGLIVEAVRDKPRLDFANPRQPPDLGAARRQRLLLGSLAAIVALGSAYTYARLDLQNRQDQLDVLTQQWTEQSATYADFVRLKARVAHVEQWRQARFDWLAHVGFLNEQLPPGGDAVLDGVTARGEQDVIYARSSGPNLYNSGAWSARLRGYFTIEGKVKRREIADSLRLSLVDDKRYTLDSKGADTADRFDWRLITTRAKPDDESPERAPAQTPPAAGSPAGAANRSAPTGGKK